MPKMRNYGWYWINLNAPVMSSRLLRQSHYVQVTQCVLRACYRIVARMRALPRFGKNLSQESHYAGKHCSLSVSKNWQLLARIWKIHGNGRCLYFGCNYLAGETRIRGLLFVRYLLGETYFENSALNMICTENLVF